MTELNLNLPAQDNLDARALDPPPHQLTGWLEILRTGNFEDAAERVLDLLRAYNRCQLEPAVRFQSMGLLCPVIRELVGSLKTRSSALTFPLNDKQRVKAELIASLLRETATGYKIVVNDLAEGDKNYRLSQDIVVQAIYQAMVFLSDSLLASYLVYVSEPAGVWGELHRLFRYAEASNLHGERTGASAASEDAVGELRTINHAYKRIVLLYLANPYHLMSGEVATVYGQLNQWAVNARVLMPDRVPSLEGKFVVDLAGEQPPHYVLHHARIEPTAEVRVLDIGRLVVGVATMVKKYAEFHADPARASMTLNDRIYRDMLQRLERAWGGRRERKDERMPRAANIVMAAGMSACHHFVGGEKPFLPERDEVRYHRPEGLQPALSLMPLEHEPWKTSEKIDKIEAQVTATRLSTFDGAEDLWEKIYATKARAHARMEDLDPEFTAQLWQQFDGSGGGMGIRCDGRGKRIRVGDLLVYKDAGHINGEWRVGVVRWLRDLHDHTLDIGVMTLAGSVYAMAVRSIGGVGSGGEYFRSLLLRDGKAKTLLLPCAIYDVGTRLVLNSGHAITYVKLTAVRETTTSFAHFEYEQIETPASEQKNIDAIRNA
jgi:hypothetical protein